jgi:hypothetical protein
MRPATFPSGILVSSRRGAADCATAVPDQATAARAAANSDRRLVIGVSLLGSGGTFARQVPYLSSVLILVVGLYVGLQGWVGLSTEAAPLSPVAPENK